MHNATGSKARKGIVMTASGALLAGTATAAVVGGTTASAGAAVANEGYPHTCKVMSGGTKLAGAKVRVRVRTSLPKKVEAGTRLKRRPIKVAIKLPESFRKLTDDFVEATHVRAKVRGAKMKVRAGHRKRNAQLRRLNFGKTAVPTEDGAPWRLRTKGKLAGVKVPKRAKGKVIYRMPKRLKVRTTLLTKDDRKRVNLRCAAPKNRRFAKVKIAG